MTRPLAVRWLGEVPYESALAEQHRVHEAVAQGAPDTLLLLEHPRTITFGAKGGTSHLLTPQPALEALGYRVLRANRGGDVTLHNPGQLVGYPIVDLRHQGRDLGRYLRVLEAAIIEAVAGLGIAATTDPGNTGVWVGRDKLCAIGIRASRWVTMHGFALNVCNALGDFDHIVACGLPGRGVCSVASLTGAAHSPRALAPRVAEALAFGLGLAAQPPGRDAPLAPAGASA